MKCCFCIYIASHADLSPFLSSAPDLVPMPRLSRNHAQNQDPDFIPTAEPENVAERPPQPTCHRGRGAANVTRQMGPSTGTLVVKGPNLGEYIDLEVSESTDEEASYSSQGHPSLAASNPPVAHTIGAAVAPTVQGSQGSARVTHDINHFF